MTQAIIDYLVVHHWNYSILTDEVCRRIDEGWQPFGGVSVSYDSTDNQCCFAQAMVKYESP